MIYLMKFDLSISLANSVDPNQRPQNVMPGIDLHFLHLQLIFAHKF